MVGRNEDVTDGQGHVMEEQHGGVATASRFYTLGQYCKTQLLKADRRFARDPNFLFWAMDIIEKQNIHSANRHTVRTSRRATRRQDVMDAEGNFRDNRVTIVPHTIRSSYAYHRRHYLNLKAMCEQLGPPQLFLTFSCDDLSPQFKHATGSEEPWTDPVIFAGQYRRKWTRFFSYYIMKRWGPSIGGIRDWSYVLEIQGKKTLKKK